MHITKADRLLIETTSIMLDELTAQMAEVSRRVYACDDYPQLISFAVKLYKIDQQLAKAEPQIEVILLYEQCRNLRKAITDVLSVIDDKVLEFAEEMRADHIEPLEPQMRQPKHFIMIDGKILYVAFDEDEEGSNEF